MFSKQHDLSISSYDTTFFKKILTKDKNLDFWTKLNSYKIKIFGEGVKMPGGDSAYERDGDARRLA